jgi:hypothetical protein
MCCPEEAPWHIACKGRYVANMRSIDHSSRLVAQELDPVDLTDVHGGEEEKSTKVWVGRGVLGGIALGILKVWESSHDRTIIETLWLRRRGGV